MNDLPRQRLCELIATYGRSLCDDPRRCEALLKDLYSQYHREVSVLVIALREGVAADLLASQRVPHEVLLAQLTKRLHDNRALAEDAALWAVESWALALGVLSSSQCQTSKAEPKSPPPVQPQYRQDQIFQPQPPTPYPVVPTPRESTQPQPIKYAAFWQRAAAALNDVMIVGFIIVGIYYLIRRPSSKTSENAEELVFSVLLWIVYLLYCALMESSRKQATLAQMALGIFVTDLNGNKISFGKAIARNFGKIISFILAPFGWFGFLMAGFTEKKQALHDMIAGCLVVRNSTRNSAQTAANTPVYHGQTSSFSMHLSSGRTIYLTVDMKLTETDIPGLKSNSFDGAVVEVNCNPNDPTTLGLKNLSHQSWTAVTASDERRQIDSGRSIKLAVGTKIHFGQVTGEIRYHS